jgi:hypothetical protein
MREYEVSYNDKGLDKGPVGVSFCSIYFKRIENEIESVRDALTSW